MKDDLLVARDVISDHPSTVSIDGKEVEVFLSPPEASDDGIGAAAVTRVMVMVGSLPVGTVVSADDGSYVVDSFTNYGSASELILFKQE